MTIERVDMTAVVASVNSSTTLQSRTKIILGRSKTSMAKLLGVIVHKERTVRVCELALGLNREKYVEQVVSDVLVLKGCWRCSKPPRATGVGSLGCMAILRCQALYGLICDALAGQFLRLHAIPMFTTV